MDYLVPVKDVAKGRPCSCYGVGSTNCQVECGKNNPLGQFSILCPECNNNVYLQSNRCFTVIKLRAVRLLKNSELLFS